LKTPTYLLALLAAAILTDANASEENNIYIGTGPAKTGIPTTSNKAPITVGYISQSRTTSTVWGIDISGEGTLLDSTWGQNNAVKQATSFNVLIGKNMSNSQISRFDIAFVAGLREKSKDCPASYLGYQCYADSAPNTTREFNYGGILSWSYQKLMVGVRATGESNQLLIGIRF
jgi:hypothetical protein